MNMFSTVEALRRWPDFMRPLVRQVLPQSTKLRKQVKLARKLMKGILENRARERDQALAEGRTPVRHEDTITWMEEAAEGSPVDRTAVQLAFAIAALHTTSEAFRMTLLEICVHPGLVQPLREEIRIVVAQNGWTIARLIQNVLTR
jgi:hypothetical protein